MHGRCLPGSLGCRRRVGEMSDERLLGGSWVAISEVISKVTIVTTHIRGLITLLKTTHEPPSKTVTEKGSELRERRRSSSS